jgi:hypothetical protein
VSRFSFDATPPTSHNSSNFFSITHFTFHLSMTDPIRTDQLPDGGDVPERDRDARVEGLLLAGLDHYFAGQHELAISVWTRVLFLDRGHARAKAYIERARGAIAERQREGEELLHTGAAAFDRGDAGEARALLTSAVEQGAGGDEALAMLDRLNRLEFARPAQARPVGRHALVEPREPPTGTVETPGANRAGWIAIGVVAGLGAAAALAWLALNRPGWLPLGSTRPSIASVRMQEDPLPVPAPSEAWISRARTLYEKRQLREALTALEAVGYGDPLKSEADELRAAIQRLLLDAARARPASAPVTPAEGPRRPPQ